RGAGMRREGGLYMDVASARTRQAGRNKPRAPRSGDLPPGARVARVVAIEPPWHVHRLCR
ncbi:hypothetical protein, partial [Enterobacter asburiae]|uniref:hypothetical protein n=1 Tax=Enterobacter asburiae TaxID=61645 RepID=UPI0029674AA2